MITFVQHFTGCMLHASGKFVPLILAHLKVRNRFFMFFKREIQNFQVLNVLSSEMDLAERKKKINVFKVRNESWPPTSKLVA